MKKNKEKQPAFSEQVYQMVSRVPKGKVATYGQIALWINRPRAARQVGQALHCKTAGVPCHRIVNCSHTAPGFIEQEPLLRAEALCF
ncbi:MAG: MGMT family protein [Christensenellales bacterium]